MAGKAPPSADVGIQQSRTMRAICRSACRATIAPEVGIGDLDGDGRYDYVIKQPDENIDPYEKLWRKSPETYKLEAYRPRRQIPLAVRPGLGDRAGHLVLALPVVYDLDGDGKAEVAVKTGEGDPRAAGRPRGIRPGVLDDSRRHDRANRLRTSIGPRGSLFSSYNYASGTRCASLTWTARRPA